MTFRIREARLRANLTQSQIAKRLGISNTTFSGYETGAHDPKSDLLIQIADICGVSVDYLLGRSPNAAGLAVRAASPAPGAPGPDLNRAAVAAAQTLADYRVSSAPVSPLSILQRTPGIIVVTFTEMAGGTALDSAVSMFGSGSQDAVTYSIAGGGRLRIVAYNTRMPNSVLQMALARELGHIVLRHTDVQPESLKTAEALIFARHLLCPRPLIRALLDVGAPLTIETVGNLTGCYGRTLAGIRETEGAEVPARLNRQIRGQFYDYVACYTEYRAAVSADSSGLADFGTYMDSYAE